MALSQNSTPSITAESGTILALFETQCLVFMLAFASTKQHNGKSVREQYAFQCCCSLPQVPLCFETRCLLFMLAFASTKQHNGKSVTEQ